MSPNKSFHIPILFILAALLWSCTPSTQTSESRILPTANSEANPPTEERQVIMAENADVLSVNTRGESGAYQFSVEIRSPDLGCEQYADWWEVVGEGGELLYRRILLHSHVNEQPFTRSGGPVPIQPDTIVWVRAHMNTSGYGGSALKGSVQAGFQPVELPPDFASDLAGLAPLPQGCDF